MSHFVYSIVFVNVNFNTMCPMSKKTSLHETWPDRQTCPVIKSEGHLNYPNLQG